MKNYIKKIIFAILYLAITLNASAKVTLPKLIGDGMVLQRNKPLKIWGWASPNEEVIISFNNELRKTITQKNGKWLAELPAQNAGGPYEFIIKGSNQIVIKDVYIGDVWLCGGQSNMDYTLSDLNFWDNEINNSNFEEIRQIKVERSTSDSLAEDVNSSGWKKAIPSELKNFSATAYFFAKELYLKNKIPIGLIGSNWSGSPVEVWMDEKTLKSFPEIESEYSKLSNKGNEVKQRMKLRESRIPLYVEKCKSNDLGKSTYFQKSLNTTEWQSLTIDELKTKADIENFDGVIWLRKEFELPQNFIKKEMSLEITSVDDADDIWVNGTKIGETVGLEKNRLYKIPSKLITDNKIIIAIRIIDYAGGCNISGNFRLNAENNHFNLDGIWKYKLSYNLKTLPEFIEPDWNAYNGWQPSKCYNAMINPLLNYSIKGAIWYQGESNAERAYQYRKLFPAFIQNWRTNFNQGDFPFLYVQLANFLSPDSAPKNDPWPELREAQSMSLSQLPNLGMAVSIDCGEIDDIHPKDKETVGKRLAYQAFSIAYNDKNIIKDGPIFESVKFIGSKAIIKFKNNAPSLVARDGKLNEFAVAGKDKKFYYANAKIIDKNTIEVICKDVESPIAVRYAWANNPSKANLYNSAGLPAHPFRTDDWEGVTYNKFGVE